MIARVRSILIALAIGLCGLLGVFSGQSVLAHAGIPTPMEQRGVMQDLSELTIDGEPWDTAAYTAAHKDFTVIHLAEYCYSRDAALRRNFALYVYVYNPAGMPLEHASGKIQLADNWDLDGNPISYGKYDLRALSMYGNLYYKYRIDGIDDLFGRLNPAERRYDISGVELATISESAHEYAVSKTYRYTGYADGCGGTDTTPLSCADQQLTTLTLDVKGNDTAWRNDLDNPDLIDRNQVNSVWFSVPNDVLSRYGMLQGLRAEWWEYRTQPMLITADDALYQGLRPWIGRDLERTTSGDTVCYTHADQPYRLAAGVDGVKAGLEMYEWTYNVDHLTRCGTGVNAWHVASQDYQARLRWLLPTNGYKLDRYVVTSEVLASYIQSYPYRTGTLAGASGDYPADLFTNDVGAGRTAGYNVKDFDVSELIALGHYDPVVSGGWHALGALLGLYTPAGQTAIPDFAPIQPVNSVDLSGDVEEVAGRLLVASQDVDELRAYVTDAAKRDETTYLLRYGVSNYHSVPVYELHDGALGVTLPRDLEAALISENVFLDFDVLSLSFVDGAAVRSVLPVVMTPVDIIPDVDVPVQPDNGLPRWVWLIVGIVGLILLGLLCVMIKPIWIAVKWIGLALWYIVSAPVRLIAWIVRKCKDKGGKS